MRTGPITNRRSESKTCFENDTLPLSFRCSLFSQGQGFEPESTFTLLDMFIHPTGFTLFHIVLFTKNTYLESMKTNPVFCFIGMLFMSNPALFSQTADESVILDAYLRVRQLTPAVWMHTHAFPWPANGLIVQMEDSSLILIDTPYTPEATELLVQWIENRWGVPPVLAVNTHFHVDNLGGNAFLLKRKIPVWGSDAINGLLKTRGRTARETTLNFLRAMHADSLYFHKHARMPYMPPDHTFPLEEGHFFIFGSDTCRIAWPGSGHSPDNVVVWFPQKKVLFGGCLILSGSRIGNTADADLDSWPVSVKKLKIFPAAVIVPGHGAPAGPELIDHTLELLDEARNLEP
ncbi:MBL fold metallo-hydrolase [bacterium]|nr:MBL fold metallo-hydrolase [bacterium]